MEYMELDGEGKERFKHFPSMILGFVQFLKGKEVSAFIRTSTRAVIWDTITSEFITAFMISENFANLMRQIIIKKAAYDSVPHDSMT